MIPSKQFVELNKSIHDRRSFDCGEAELNTFLQEPAARHRKAGISKTMVLPEDTGDDTAAICAYYALSHTEIMREKLLKKMAKRLPAYPIPVMLLAQLAVHQVCQGQKLGEATLITALKDALNINHYLPCYAVVVDSIALDVQVFYEQYGFQELGRHNGRVRLFLPMKTVEQLI